MNEGRFITRGMVDSSSDDAAAGDEIGLRDKNFGATVDVGEEWRPNQIVISEGVRREARFFEIVIGIRGVKLLEFKLGRPRPINLDRIMSNFCLSRTPARRIRGLRPYSATQPG